MYRLIVFTFFAAAAVARQFNNPLFEKQELANTSPVKYKGNYYLISTFELNYDDTFTMLMSKDLQYWDAKTVSVAQADGEWSLRAEDPELHVLSDNQFRIYFSHYEDGYTNISSLYATDILGPYYYNEKPVINVRDSADSPTLFKSYGVLYMAWTQMTKEYDFVVYGQKILPDGLSATNEPIQFLLNGTLPWEKESIVSPFIMQRGDYYYLFYNGIMDCRDNTSGIGVARSLFPLGPYEKFGNTIIEGGPKFMTPRYPYVVKDVDDKTDVLVYGCYKTSANCMTNPFDYTCANSITWSKDNWPVIEK